MRLRTRPASGGFELYAWFFMRVSGILLILLALGHFGYMHLLNGVEKIDYEFVARQYRTPFWKTYDLLLLSLALVHGANGARTLIDDYIHARGWRALFLAALYTASFFFLVVGALVIVTFQRVR
ncbi:MAG: succinate dehydrogenase, hydrophobic membrane anchor protein [Armatimonadota bacterium]|nr:succinate dehydrogenase, hydrophobic membrane anchor protein [Armatimonadota bacterium]